MPLALALLQLFTTPFAADPAWYRIAGDDDMIYYVEANSIATEGTHKMALTLTARSQPTGSGAYFIAVTVEYDCEDGRYRDLDFAYLDAEGSIMRTEESRAGPNFRTPAAGSYNARMMRFVCERTGGTRVDNPMEDSEGYFTH